VAILLAYSITQGEYRTNLRLYGRLMPSNTDKEFDEFKNPGVALMRIRMWQYDFRPDLFVRYSWAPRYDKPVWDQPVYKKIPTSMVALFWDDLGFFSKEGASQYYYYAPKKTPLSFGRPVSSLSPPHRPFAWGVGRHGALARFGCGLGDSLHRVLIALWYLRLIGAGDPSGSRRSTCVRSSALSGGRASGNVA